MYRKMHSVHRHTGRMTRDPSMRPSNKAEVGAGLIGLAVPIIILAVFISWVMEL
jgi:hypothetical protein